MAHFRYASALAFAAAAWYALPALAAPFATGNIVVYRVGTGAAALTNASTAVFIDEYTTSGALVQSVAFPTTVSGANRQLTASGTATSEGLMTLSTDGRYLVAVGYGADPGVASISGTSTATVPRVVARIDGAGTVDTSTVLTDYSSGNNPRGAASVDGSAFWVTGGAGGVRYATLGATTSTQLSTTVTNIRSTHIFGGQLYVSTGSGSAVRVGTVGAGTPTTTGQIITNLPGYSPSTGSPYAFVLADLDAGVAGVDTLYVADDTSPTAGMSKYSLVGGNWVANGTVTGVFRGLTARVTGTNVTLFATRGGNEIVSLTDTSGYNAALTGVPALLATAAANTAFRGVAFVPSAATNADLSVSLNAPGNATVNVPYDYSIAVNNNTSVAANAIKVTFAVPTGVTVNMTTPSHGFGCGAPVSGTITCTGGSLNALASATITVNVTAAATGPVTVTAGAISVDPDNTIVETNETNNTAPTSAVITTVSAAGNTPPTIQGAATTTARLSVPLASPADVSGVLNDPTDPARTLGIDFTVGDAETAAGSLAVTATSNSTTVVPNTAAALALTGTGATRTLRITPSAVGKAQITVTVTDGGSLTATYVINYAASAAGLMTTRYHTGAADASTAIAVDVDHMLIADDESQVIRLYKRQDSGLHIASFDFTSSLGLTDLSGGVPREVDIEASTRVGSRVFWLGSHSNSSGGAQRLNRSRLFATDIAGAGATTTLSYVGRYDNLKADLIAWDQTNGHGLGANFFGLAASAATGVVPEAADGSGWNIEGLTMKPGSTTEAYVGFRAPLASAALRTRALVVPVTNFTALIGAGGTPGVGPATFGAPIQLDLGGRGIRSMEANGTQVLIVAGPPDSATGVAPKDFRLYTWTGNAADQPVLRAANLSGVNAEGIVEVPSALTDSTVIDIVSDNGDDVYYGDGVIAKDLPQRHWAKFRVDRVTLGAPVVAGLRIRDIQGRAHRSPYEGQSVTGVEGIVTLVRSNGFYMQDSTSDADEGTSEGLFVFTSSAPPPAATVGNRVSVSGTVLEFRSGTVVDGNLTLSEITTPTITQISTGNALPAPIVIGTGGRTPPLAVIKAAAGNVETSGTFNPSTEGIDFYESLEGMRVSISNPVAVGPTDSGEVPVVPDNGTWATLRTSRGGVVIQSTDFNPERIVLIGSGIPAMKVGDRFNGTIEGVLDYTGGNYKLRFTSVLPSVVASTLSKEITALTSGATQLTVATMNVENLAPTNPASKFNNIASALVNNLRSPDIVLLEEVQDNSGATNNGIVDATTTITTLITAITTAGGPTYGYRQIDPVNNSDGGQGGGNIRQVFLFNPARVTFVDRAGGSGTAANSVNAVAGLPQLSASPGRIDPTNTAFNSSRKPLAGEFVFNGHTIFVIGNHFNSKGGDNPLFGFNQPPVLNSEAQRQQQASVVRNFVQSLYAVDATTNVIVLGDLNDFEFSAPVNTLKNAPLTALIEKLPTNERYTYVFEGNSQALDHIMVSPTLDTGAAAEFDVVHINAEYTAADRVSDHDPGVARFTLEQAPTQVVFSSVNGGSPPLVGTGFSIVVSSADGTGAARKVLAATTVTITVQSGTGTLTTSTCIIPVGGTSCTVAGAVYSRSESGVVLRANATAGKKLTGNSSAAFSVIMQAPTQAQTITFAGLPARVFGDAPFNVSAAASSGLAVTLTSSTQTVCTVSGASPNYLIAIVGGGVCTLTANQPGDATFIAAPSVSQSFTVARRGQSITFPAVGNRVLGAVPFVVPASASSALAVLLVSRTPNVCEFDAPVFTPGGLAYSNRITLRAQGICTVEASQAGDNNWLAAASVVQSFDVGNVVLQQQTINFPPLVARNVGDIVRLAATATSGLAVSFMSTTPDVCAVQDTTIRVLAAGTCTIQATQAGSAQFGPAPVVTQSFNVVGASCNVANADGDCDSDGIPNGVELADGTNPLAKDNDIFSDNAASKRRFIKQIYRDALEREADPDGLALWLDRLERGESRAQIAAAFVFLNLHSRDVRATLILRAVTGSEPTAEWVRSVSSQLTAQSVESIVVGLLADRTNAERMQQGTATEFVQLLYRQLFGREGDAAGVNFWVSQLGAGLSRGDLVVRFTSTTEFDRYTERGAQVDAVYRALLRRTADAQGLGYWSRFATDTSDLRVLVAFLESAEYRARFLP